jgi:hypothetical protein
MDVVAVKNKKIRLLTSFLIIALSIILLIYAIICDEPIVILVVFILIVKIIDLIFNFYRVRRKKQKFQY